MQKLKRAYGYTWFLYAISIVLLYLAIDAYFVLHDKMGIIVLPIFSYVFFMAGYAYLIKYDDKFIYYHNNVISPFTNNKVAYDKIGGIIYDIGSVLDVASYKKPVANIIIWEEGKDIKKLNLRWTPKGVIQIIPTRFTVISIMKLIYFLRKKRPDLIPQTNDVIKKLRNEFGCGDRARARRIKARAKAANYRTTPIKRRKRKK